ncbi:MAG: SET domain-containing protein [Pseudomonadota bacterium]
MRETSDRGLAVFAEEPIPKGSLVWRFMPSQFAVYDEAAFKAHIAGLTEEQAIYELTHMFGAADFPNCVIRVLDAGVLFNHATDHTLASNYDVPPGPPLDEHAPGYIDQVTDALLSDRYAMMAVRNIEVGDEFTNNYHLELDEPAFFEDIYDSYEIDDSYLKRFA